MAPASLTAPGRDPCLASGARQQLGGLLLDLTFHGGRLGHRRVCRGETGDPGPRLVSFTRAFAPRGPGQVGQVFNAVNQKGPIRFLDGQTGRQASFEDFKDFFFLPTR